ncbi:hypothetical protein like AT4G16640 [Hibiscus trionum]|uniref:Peptidase metallopeptidase domain-containing protein n=1 Tax=Hibiscus trionum TaxID=183268 RepID=A0A9W7MF12_HIBTR|nr:hypothetical protein like AT4G16640 [Hibiscus trionum]
MAHKLSTQFFGAFLVLFVLQPFVIKSLEFESIQNLEGAQKGDVVNGLNQIKKYLYKYGYYHHDIEGTIDDKFDDSLESALKAYQNYLGIDVTGKIDSDTIEGVLTPRCGVPDHLVSSAKWRTRSLDWRISSTVNVFPDAQLSPVLTKAFTSWAKVSPFKFTMGRFKTDIVIGFLKKDHADGFPFKDKEFAHAFPPPDGRLHFYAKWNWTFDPTGKGGKTNKVDVQSIAVHEIGHLLGLDHSNRTSAVMYAFYKPGTIKRDLTDEDKKRIKALYPN